MTPDSEGLHRIANTTSSGITADVVFVHGLIGGSHSTWRHGEEGKDGHFFWPEELGQALPHCAIWSLGYAAEASHWFSEESMALDDLAADFALKLSIKEFGNRPLIFVTYSMGGLVVKEFLADAHSLGGADWNAAAQSARGVVFLGTPHHGSQMASIAKGFAVLLRTQEHLKQMKFAGPTLDQLHRRFMKWQSNSRCPIETYVETRGIARTGFFSRFFLARLTVVPRISGDPCLVGCDCYPISADHITLVKPASRDSDVYAGVLRFILKALAAPVPPAATVPVPAAPSRVVAAISIVDSQLGVQEWLPWVLRTHALSRGENKRLPFLCPNE